MSRIPGGNVRVGANAGPSPEKSRTKESLEEGYVVLTRAAIKEAAEATVAAKEPVAASDFMTPSPQVGEL